MHVGIVLHPFGNSLRGLEQYVFETTKAILEEAKEGVEFTVFVKGNPDTSGLPKGVRVVNLPSTFLGQFQLFRWSKRCDAFIFFTESAPILLWKKSIVVFLDAAYCYFGSQTLLARIKREVLMLWRGAMMRTARRVVTISEASRRDLVEKFRVPKERISVIYPGFKSFTFESSTKDTLGEHQPYFMYVGPIKERKNVARIVEAFILFKEKTNLEHRLLLVGRKSSGDYEECVDKLIRESDRRDSIITKTAVTDEELRDLYTNAEALVFPSILEGFGLPVLEALSCGCMVVTSSTTSTKEVLGSAGMLVEPQDVSEIAAMMTRVARGEYDREVFLKDASVQCAKFSWEKSGQEWNVLLRSLVSK